MCVTDFTCQNACVSYVKIMDNWNYNFHICCIAKQLNKFCC